MELFDFQFGTFMMQILFKILKIISQLLYFMKTCTNFNCFGLKGPDQRLWLQKDDISFDNN